MTAKRYKAIVPKEQHFHGFMKEQSIPLDNRSELWVRLEGGLATQSQSPGVSKGDWRRYTLEKRIHNYCANRRGNQNKKLEHTY